MVITVARSEKFERERKLLTDALSAIPYDVATFSEHAIAANGDQWLRIHLVVFPDQPAYRWSRRWMRVAPGLLHWLKSSHRWVDDVTAYASGLMIEPDKNDRFFPGIHSSICQPSNEGDAPEALLVLGARAPATYNATHLALLKDPRINEMLETIRVSLRNRQKQFAGRLYELFGKGLQPEVLAGRFAKAIATEFDWPYVGVFRVEREQGRFALVSQCDRSDGNSLRIAPNYMQAIDAGMLG